MRKTYAMLGAAVLAVGMFVAGALGPFRPGMSRPAPAEGSVTTRASALGVAPGPGALDRTIASLQRTVRSGTRDWRPLAQLGLAFLTKARITADPSLYPRAETLLRTSLRNHPVGNVEARVGLGVLAAARHDFTAALRWGREARRMDRFDADALGVVTDALVELGRYRAAVRAAQEMVDLRPSLAAMARVAYLRELHGDVAGAIEAMSLGLDYAGGGAEAAWAAHQIGELRFGSGHVAAARKEYARALYLAPGFPPAEIGLARVRAARGDLAGAADLLEGVVERYPTAEAVILLGDVYRAAGDAASARRQYELVRAMDRLARANGVDSDLEMALFAADHGRRAGAALRAARRGWSVRRSVQAADALAWTLYANRRYEEAMRASMRALRLGTRSALFEFHAGMIARALGRDAAARRHLERSLAINPRFSLLHASAARGALRALEEGRA